MEGQTFFSAGPVTTPAAAPAALAPALWRHFGRQLGNSAWWYAGLLGAGVLLATVFFGVEILTMLLLMAVPTLGIVVGLAALGGLLRLPLLWAVARRRPDVGRLVAGAGALFALTAVLAAVGIWWHERALTTQDGRALGEWLVTCCLVSLPGLLAELISARRLARELRMPARDQAPPV